MNRKYLRGSLTIEASLVIPFFLFAMFLVLSVINLQRFHLNLQEALHQETKKLAMEGYTKWGTSAGEIKEAVIKRLEGAYKGKAPIKGGIGGVDFSASRFDNRELAFIYATYDAELPYDFFGLFDHRLSAKCVMHTFIGYEHGLTEVSHGEEGEDHVFITETGTVYHNDRECTYLRLSIKETDMASLKDLRNSSGHRYYACEKCGRHAGGRVYITSDGTCYHSSLTCSGLKRTVMSIPVSEAKGRRACSRCGH